ncbi:sugar kinase [Agromyces subbeticus]|uniref:sugar kinase n=1 Tax=Agromyces subbeticus TaxID=293890 RepID=UPI0003B70856|nr:sugar kinase [Agromyces subbeticus]
MADVVTLGESLCLMRSASADSLELTADLRLSVGGAESNVAIGLSRLGASVEWIGRVGDDELGRRIVRELRAEGVTARAIIDPGAPTALMLKERRVIGPSRVRYYRAGSAGSRIAPGDVPLPSIAAASMLHVTGITPSLSPTADAAIDAAVGEAVAQGVPVSFDVNHRATLPRHRDAGEIYRSIATRSSLVFAGEDEARLLAPNATDRDSLLHAIAALGPREIVLKLGSEGAVALVDGSRYSLPAVPVPVVDTVGAGDAFVAGYLAERVRGLSPEERLVTATRCGAYACTVAGDWEGAPRRIDLASLELSGEDVLR